MKPIETSANAVATSGGNRPIMRSINILMTRDIQSSLEDTNPESRSMAVREATAVILEAIEQGYTWVLEEITECVRTSCPQHRKIDEQNGTLWEKAIVWIPENMLREIERVALPNQMKPSEFLRGVVIYATQSKDEE